MDLDKIKDLRYRLHQFPNLSNEEGETVKILDEFILPYGPSNVIRNIGGDGVAYIFGDDEKVKTIALRADLDALPIQEENEINYKSKNQGVSHKCGHDGHMSMVCGILENKNSLKECNLILLFQPAEETGEGGKRIAEDPKFKNLKIDYIFGLHNLPGVPEGKILSRDGVFACSSVGMKIKLEGLTSHAADPQKAMTPYPFLQELYQYINQNNSYDLDEKFKIITLTHVEIGEKTFGITPGTGEFYLTLRSISDQEISQFKEDITNLTHMFKDYNFDISFHDDFPALENTKKGFQILNSAGESFDFESMTQPFKWSEDFGHLLKNNEGAYFGIGVGEDHYNLHHKDYDFNDRIIELGINFYTSIINTAVQSD